MSSIVRLFTGPRLYGVFNHQLRSDSHFEKIGSSVLSCLRGLYYFATSLAFSPWLLIFLYSRGMLNTSSVFSILKFASIFTCFGYCVRFFGRSMDNQYCEFINVWARAYEGSKKDQEELKKYDFDLEKVVPDFEAKKTLNLWYLVPNVGNVNMLTEALAYYAIHSFGRQMLYPGSLAILNYLMIDNMNQARRLMVQNKDGQRVWIKNSEGDLVDAMFIPGVNPEFKNILVITCEGNAGFYEIGVANTPAQAGYAVLAWNQPGFGQSSGLPWPKNTLSSADAVMQYARNVLGYKTEQIVLFGWSIGGFPVSWLAANYPEVKGVILDATFDDVLPLAESRMPKIVQPIVEYAIRKYANLQIDKILAEYKGPLKLIRRLHEEILTTSEDVPENEKRASNRCNYLLKSVLKTRHPELLKGLEPQVDRWLDMTPTERLMSNGVTLREASSQRKRLFDACNHYLVDYDANHVTPLDPLYFNIPEATKSF